MRKVIPVYEAKTNLIKLIRRAQAVIAPAPVKKPIQIGVWAHKKKANAYKTEDLIDPSTDIIAAFERSVGQPL
jgi:hypothetical protein